MRFTKGCYAIKYGTSGTTLMISHHLLLYEQYPHSNHRRVKTSPLSRGMLDSTRSQLESRLLAESQTEFRSHFQLKVDSNLLVSILLTRIQAEPSRLSAYFRLYQKSCCQQDYKPITKTLYTRAVEHAKWCQGMPAAAFIKFRAQHGTPQYAMII